MFLSFDLVEFEVVAVTPMLRDQPLALIAHVLVFFPRLHDALVTRQPVNLLRKVTLPVFKFVAVIREVSRGQLRGLVADIQDGRLQALQFFSGFILVILHCLIKFMIEALLKQAEMVTEIRNVNGPLLRVENLSEILTRGIGGS